MKRSALFELVGGLKEAAVLGLRMMGYSSSSSEMRVSDSAVTRWRGDGLNGVEALRGNELVRG